MGTFQSDPHDTGGGSAVINSVGAGLALSGGGALTNPSVAATFITQVASADLSAEQALGALATGILKSTTTTGVLSIAVAGTDYVAPDVAVASGKKIILDPSTSLTSCPMQFGSDPNTGLSQPSGADTLAIVAGGTKWLDLSFATGTLTHACHNTWGNGLNIAFGTGGGSIIATAVNQKMGFWAKTPIVQPTNGANLTNNVTVGGTTDQIDDFTGAVYATDAATIRNDIYQLAKKLKVVNDALRLMGLMS